MKDEITSLFMFDESITLFPLGIFTDGIIRGALAVVEYILLLIYKIQLSFIEGIFSFVGSLTVQTPTPDISQGVSSVLLSGGGPSEGTWEAVYNAQDAFTQVAIGLVILFFFIMYAFEVWEEFASQSLVKGANKSDFLFAGVFILFSWQITVIILLFSDALAQVFLNIPGENGASSDNVFDSVFDMIMNRAEEDMGVAGLFILILWTSIVSIASLVFSLLWVVNHFLIVILAATVPLMFAFKPLKIPGLKVLSKLGSKAWGFWLLMVFLSVPGAILGGFIGILVDNLLSGDGEFSCEGDNCISGEEHVDNIDPDRPTSDDEDVSSEIVEINSGELLGSAENNDLLSNPHVEHGETLYQSTYIVSETGQMQLSIGGSTENSYVATVILLVVATSIPLVTAAGPWILARYVGGATPHTGIGAAKSKFDKARSYTQDAKELSRRYQGQTKAYNESTGEYEVTDIDTVEENDNLSATSLQTSKASTAESVLDSTDSVVSGAVKGKEKVKDNAIGAMKDPTGTVKRGSSEIASRSVKAPGKALGKTKGGIKQTVSKASSVKNHRAIGKAHDEMKMKEESDVISKEMNNRENPERVLTERAIENELAGYVTSHQKIDDIENEEDLAEYLRELAKKDPDKDEDARRLQYQDHGYKDLFENNAVSIELDRLEEAVGAGGQEAINSIRRKGSQGNLDYDEFSRNMDKVEEELGNEGMKEFGDEVEKVRSEFMDKTVENSKTQARNEVELLQNGDKETKEAFVENIDKIEDTRERFNNKDIERNVEEIEVGSSRGVDTLDIQKASMGAEDIQASLEDGVRGMVESKTSGLGEDQVRKIVEETTKGLTKEISTTTDSDGKVKVESKGSENMTEVLEEAVDKATSEVNTEVNMDVSDVDTDNIIDENKITKDLEEQIIPENVARQNSDPMKEVMEGVKGDEIVKSVEQTLENNIQEQVEDMFPDSQVNVADSIDSKKITDIIGDNVDVDVGGSIDVDDSSIQQSIENDVKELVQNEMDVSNVDLNESKIQEKIESQIDVGELEFDGVKDTIEQEMSGVVDEIVDETKSETIDMLEQTTEQINKEVSEIVEEASGQSLDSEELDKLEEIADEVTGQEQLSQITDEIAEQKKQQNKALEKISKEIKQGSTDRYIDKLTKKIEKRLDMDIDKKSLKKNIKNREGTDRNTGKESSSDEDKDDVDLNFKDDLDEFI